MTFKVWWYKACALTATLFEYEGEQVTACTEDGKVVARYNYHTGTGFFESTT